MAIPKIIIAAFAAFLVNLIPAHANECFSIDTYHSTLSSEGVKLYGSKAAATHKLEKQINENRVSNGREAIEASVFLVGYMKNANGDIVAVVAVFDRSGCLIEDTLVVLPLKIWVDFVTSAGVEPKDFIELSGA